MNDVRFFQVVYTDADGNSVVEIAAGQTYAEAINHVKHLRNGKDFRVVGEVPEQYGQTQVNWSK